MPGGLLEGEGFGGPAGCPPGVIDGLGSIPGPDRGRRDGRHPVVGELGEMASGFGAVEPLQGLRHPPVELEASGR